jgi:hypothetical protein
VSANELLDDLRAQGFTLCVNGGRLDVSGPIYLLKDGMGERIREHKAALIAILNARQPTPETSKD